MAQLLLERGADPDQPAQDGAMPPLHEACWKNHVDVARLCSTASSQMSPGSSFGVFLARPRVLARFAGRAAAARARARHSMAMLSPFEAPARCAGALTAAGGGPPAAHRELLTTTTRSAF